jgi:acetyltransferase-like isoleucine patch superfamily enzyme
MAGVAGPFKLTLGARCCVGEFCKIIDIHFHPVAGDRHETPDGAEVVLEDDVTLDPWAIVLAGARIGRGARTGAATVIHRAGHLRHCRRCARSVTAHGCPQVS